MEKQTNKAKQKNSCNLYIKPSFWKKITETQKERRKRYELKIP